jgi:hypothetical protein
MPRRAGERELGVGHVRDLSRQRRVRTRRSRAGPPAATNNRRRAAWNGMGGNSSVIKRSGSAGHQGQAVASLVWRVRC